MRSGHRLSIVGAVLVVISFFLPWITVSCSSLYSVSFTGYELAAGKQIGGESVQGDQYVWLILVSALVSLVLVIASVEWWLDEPLPSLGQLASAGIALLIVFLKWLDMRSQIEEAVIANTHTELGLWGTLAGLLFVAVGGLWNLLGGPARPQYRPTRRFPQNKDRY